MLFSALAHGIYVLSADKLIQEALNAYQIGEEVGLIQYDSFVTSLVSLFIYSCHIILLFLSFF